MSMLNHFFNYKPEVLALDEKAMELCQPYFRHMEEIRDFNQLKMLKAFADTQMSSTDMLGTTGYGLWDTGRAKLEQIFAEVMGAEDALVRSQFQSGTHTLAVALFGLLRAGDTLLAATGRPYDTLEGVIGLDVSQISFIRSSITNKSSNACRITEPIVIPFSSTECWSRYPTLIFLAHSILPSSGISFPVIIFINVDFPSPLAPTSPICSPFNNLNDTSSNIALSPNPCVRCSTFNKLIYYLHSCAY